MAQPVFGSGNTPQRSDTRLFLLSKYLRALGGTGVNAPALNDTRRRLLVKIDRVKINTLPALPLTNAGAGIIDWSGFTGSDPVGWRVFQNAVLIFTTLGFLRSFDTSSLAGAYTVQGVDGSGNAVTQLSNSITI